MHIITMITLDKIEVIDKPYKQTYFIGDKVDTDGLKLKAYYSDGTTRTVTSGYTISPKTLSKVGNTKVNVKYQDETINYKALDMEYNFIGYYNKML